MQVKIELENGIKFIHIGASSLDSYHRLKLEELFLPEKPGMIFALDLSEVTFLDSSVLGIFLSTHRNLEQKNCKLVVFGLTPPIVGLFKLTSLEYIIKTYATKADVVAHEPAPANFDPHVTGS